MDIHPAGSASIGMNRMEPLPSGDRIGEGGISSETDLFSGSSGKAGGSAVQSPVCSEADLKRLFQAPPDEGDAKISADSSPAKSDVNETSKNGPGADIRPSADTHRETKKDTYLFVLNSSGETNMCKPMITALKNQGYEVKVLHFRENSKTILTGQSVLDEKDFIDGTNALYLPKVGSIFEHEIDPARIRKIVSTPHHAYCRLVFSKAKKLGIPSVAVIDLGIPGVQKMRFRQTFYKSIGYADRIIVPNDTVLKQIEAANGYLKKKGMDGIDTGKVSLGGNPGFEAFHQLVEMNRKKADQIREELSIGRDDMVFSFSSQPTDTNGKILETVGKSLAILSDRYPDRKIHMMLVPHPRDLKKVGLKNLFGTETSISIDEKMDILRNGAGKRGNVVVHEMPKYTMEKASAISGAVLTEGSTTAYECARADIPSAFVRTAGQGEGGAFPGFNRIPTLKDPEKLADCMDGMTKNPPKGLSEDLLKVVDSSIEPVMNVLLQEK
ncbi:MAG: hypothetical protein AB9903_19965 [Vulcanimicrobiota bacterium]